MGKTRDLFKKIRHTKGTFHAKMGSIKDRNGRDLTEAEDIKSWKEYTEELYKKALHDPWTRVCSILQASSFVVMLHKTHLTWHSRMSSFKRGITPSWLSGSWRSFLCSSYVYSCHLFLISSVSVRSIPFLSFIVPIFAWNVPLVSLIFLNRSLVFPLLFFSSISLHWSPRKAFLSLLASLWNSIQVDISFLFFFASHFSSFHSYL